MPPKKGRKPEDNELEDDELDEDEEEGEDGDDGDGDKGKSKDKSKGKSKSKKGGAKSKSGSSDDDDEQPDEDEDEGDEDEESPLAREKRLHGETRRGLARVKRDYDSLKQDLATLKAKLKKGKAADTSSDDEDDDDDDEASPSVRDKDREIERLRSIVRRTQVHEAVADYLADNHPDYVISATDIALNVREADELGEDDAILENHKFDKELLEEIVGREAKRFVRRNPRDKRQKSGDREGSGAEGSPLRNGNGRRAGNDKDAKAKRDERIEKRFPGLKARLRG